MYVHQDLLTGKYHHTNDTVDYVFRNHELYAKGRQNNDMQIIPTTVEQRLFYAIVDALPDDKIEEILDDFRKWLEENIFINHRINTRYKLIDNKKENLKEVRFDGIIISGLKEKKDYIIKFLEYYSIHLIKCKFAMIIFKNYTMENGSEEFEKAMSSLNENYPITDVNDRLARIYIKSCRDGDVKDLSDSFKKGLIKHIQDTHIIKDVSYQHIGINNVENGNTGLSNHGEINNDNMNNFIQHIRNDKPDWYTPGEYIPKMLIVNKYNERYNDDITSRSFWKYLTKSGIKDEIVAQEKTCRTSIDGEKNKVYRCFKPEKLNNEYVNNRKIISNRNPQYVGNCNNKRGLIYLLQEREFFNQKIPIYKIGRTSQKGLKRFNSYPKGSILYCVKYSNDILYDENQMKSIFDDVFILSPDKGNLQDMIEIFDDYFDVDGNGVEFYKESNKINNNNLVRTYIFLSTL